MEKYKKVIQRNKLKISAPAWNIMSLNFLTDDIQYQIFKIISSISSKNMEE